MRSAFVTSLFLALIVPVFAASLVARQDCPPPKKCPKEKSCTPEILLPCLPRPRFCSKCPRKDNADHPLQAEIQDTHYVHCRYKDTDCFYGPKGSSPNRLAYSYPADACPTVLGDNVCSNPLPPIQNTLLNTKCPDTNQAFVHTPVRSEVKNPNYIQCHYSNSECYYDKITELLDTSLSIPKTVFGSTKPGCRPRLVDQHLQIGF